MSELFDAKKLYYTNKSRAISTKANSIYVVFLQKYYDMGYSTREIENIALGAIFDAITDERFKRQTKS